jgi:hypothetical protein
VPDVAQMRRAATGFFGTWKPGTVLVDGQEPATVYAGAFGVTDRVHLAAPGNPAAESGVHVVMGGVGYRVSEALLAGAARDDQSLTRLVGALRAAGTRLYGQVEIGAVDITPSREALRDTDKTIRTVRQVLAAVRDGIAAAVQAELDSHPDIARAGFALATIRACQVFCVSRGHFLVDLAADPVRVGDRQCAERSLPAGRDVPFDEPALGLASALEPTLRRSLAGSFVLDVADRQPQQLDHGVVVREMPTVLDDLPQLIVQALDRVRGVDDLPDRPRERQERDEPLPRVLPRP